MSDISENPPILFGDESAENEYQRKAREIRQKLLEATDSKNVTEFMVKLCYGEDFYLPTRMLDYQYESHGKGVLELADAIEKIDSYNEFRGKDVAEAVRYLHNKGYVMDAKFGREGSPVLYVNPPYWNNQSSNYVEDQHDRNHFKYSDEERETMYSSITRTLKKYKPDELDRTDYGGVRA